MANGKRVECEPGTAHGEKIIAAYREDGWSESRIGNVAIEFRRPASAFEQRRPELAAMAHEYRIARKLPDTEATWRLLRDESCREAEEAEAMGADADARYSLDIATFAGRRVAEYEGARLGATNRAIRECGATPGPCACGVHTHKAA